MSPGIVTHAGDVVRARAEYASRRGANLRYVLATRYGWMQRHLEPDAYAVELGCGAGFGGFFLKAGRLELTDVAPQPWVDRVVDALAMPYSDASVDALLVNNVIHHLAQPHRFFAEAARVLRPGGRLLLQECDASLTTRAVIRLTGHEAYSFDVDPFDPLAICNDPADPWSANCALPNLLFDNLARFQRAFPAFRVEEHRRVEFLLHFNSGGFASRTPYLPLPWAGMRLADALDRVLVGIAPGLFAAQRRVSLVRVL